MMYKEKFVVVIKSDGKVLRDVSGKVYIPFGNEYSILLKNKNSVNSIATVEVDGEDVLQGKSIIVPPNKSVEIKGWMRSMSKTNKFRFIKKTKQIEKFRGNKPDDGIIRVEYRFESVPKFIMPEVIKHKTDWYQPSGYYTDDFTIKGLEHTTTYTCNCSQVCDDGITIKGKKIDQQYSYGDIGVLEDLSHVIILNLCGTTKTGKKINKVVITRSKIQCNICGKRWKSNIKYCGNCGNYLH